jgi:hypothetical protein
VSLFLLFVPLLAAGQTTSTRDKSFRESEMRRYRSLSTRTGDAAATDSRYDVTFYGIDIAITTTPQYLSGSVLMRAQATIDGLADFTVDLMSSLTVDSVLVNDTLATLVRFPSSFTVVPARAFALGESFATKIYYQGVPGSSGFGSFAFASHAGTPWVWTLSEPYGAKDWWPCKDHPSDKADSVDIRVRCNSALKAASNGRLMSVTDHGDGTHTYAWEERYPVSSYLVFVSITNYAEFTDWFHYGVDDSMPVLNYVLPEHLSSAMIGLPRAVEMLGIYSNLFGLYPFAGEKYGHNEFGWGGGMEHQTMTSLGGFGEYLVAHELAHQWFGDMITCRTWPDIWLNEGFATYCEALYSEVKYGAGTYAAVIGGEFSAARTANGTLYVQDTGSVGSIFNSARTYSKGASVLHMLRHVVGDSIFFASMYNYANDPALKYGTASTADFQGVFEATSGNDLDYFFNEWVFGEKYPRYSFGWSAVAESGAYRLRIHLSQSNATANPLFFTMPIDFRISSGGWDTTVVLFNDSLAQTFELLVAQNPSTVELDPDNWILKDLVPTFSFTRSSLTFSNPPVFFGSERTDSVLAENNDLQPVTITSAATDNPEFSVTPTSAVVPPSGSAKFYVTFRPASVGQRLGTLLFTHSAPSSPDAVSLVGFGALQTYPYAVERGWNLLSLPLIVPDPRPSSVFTSAMLPAYVYDSTTHHYYGVDTLRPGIGYWLRYGSKQTINVGGIKFYLDTVSLSAGWNLIGSVSVPVPVSAVQTDPDGILASPFFEYAGTYCASDSLEPARGYWIKASASGSLILSGSAPQSHPRSTIDQELFARCAVVAIEDAGGDIRRVFVAPPGETAVVSERYALPPLPPDGVFDVRFASNTAIGDVAKHELPLRITSGAYPLRITVERPLAGYAFRLRAEGVDHDLMPEGCVIRTAAQLSLVAGPEDALPVAFSLSQNYPNPFNPFTTIAYALPVASIVRLELVDVSGRLVRTITPGLQAAGFHTALWDGTSAEGTELSSGVYAVRISAAPAGGTAPPFSAVRKMLLLR